MISLIARTRWLSVCVVATLSVILFAACSADVIDLRAKHQVATDKLREQQETLTKALKQADIYARKNPQDPKAYVNLANLYYSVGDFDSAVKGDSKAIELGYDHDDAYLQRGTIYHVLLDVQRAAADYEHAVKLNPHNDLAWIRLSDAYFRLGNLKRAIECGDKVADDSPLAWVADENKAIALFAQKKYGQVIAEASKAISKNDDASEEIIALHLLRADANELLGNGDVAQKERDSVKKLVSARLHPDEAVANQLGRNFKHASSSTHVTIYSDMSIDEMHYYNLFLEDFIQHVDKYYCKVPENMHVSLFMLADKKTFQEYMHKNFAEEESLYGEYKPSYNSLFTYNGAGLGTFTHELMHKIIDTSLLGFDPWAFEGLPAFFEKIYGYSDGFGSTFLLGFQNPWRIEELGDSLPNINLRRQAFQKATLDSRSESKERMIAMFLNKNGVLQKYFQLAQKGSKGKYNTYLEAAFDRDLSQIEPLWKEYLLSVKSREAYIMQMPLSQVFRTQDEFDKFVPEHRSLLQLRW